MASKKFRRFVAGLALAVMVSACKAPTAPTSSPPRPDPPPPIQGNGLELIYAPQDGWTLGKSLYYEFKFRYGVENPPVLLYVQFLDENKTDVLTNSSVITIRSNSGQDTVMATVTGQSKVTETYFFRGIFESVCCSYTVLFSQDFPRHYYWKTPGP